MKNSSQFLRRLTAALLLLITLLPVAALTASAELLPGLDGVGGNATDAPLESRAPSESTPPPIARDGGSGRAVPDSPSPGRGALWGVLIAVGIAALAVTVIFLIMPSREEREEETRRQRR